MAEDHSSFSFGVIADVQFGDKDDAEASEGNGRIKRYREAPQKLSKAVMHFNSRRSELEFVLSLGDIIDGNVSPEKTTEDFETILAELQKLELPAFHVLGNHCLSLPRESVMAQLGMPASYYVQEMSHAWSLVVLDTMDMSTKWSEDTQNFKEATEFLHAHPLGDDHPQMSLSNGGIGSIQMSWLKEVIANAERNKIKLIVAAHHPVVAGSAPDGLLAWNHQEISSVLVESSAFVLFLCGHHHPGGYACINGKHFVTVQAILEAPTGSQAHAVVNVFDRHKITIQGTGTVISRVLEI
ncbi:manganese-dependent ADP-ribose/CDP-alcohol diphosphatase-like isoform X1 [Selaginella moellendorffii]|uniref:manganese-dependent ADP-ribose/CDP-alcohol diphosphatase-like isoform X1 n=1 Tax=Selaginella moellendorffii TaxID=88036 RepID=UPI000D1C99FF|nr:manganese-dependent ADP-ribose/CDP-alcohol diphosphatase-like isoform X1 [Selaginella moellendorffii]|eukprot:XP_024533152.1 manganese-dependent ADP-ribose/CDP-alcohol diphosphatase-like isoform X1 [Selaginella moellendorffii]